MLITRDNHTKSIIKSITWRILATLTTITLVFMFTKRIALALEIGLLEISIKLIFYYLHERVWNKISWGQKINP